MSHPHPGITPADLGEHPELAVLQVLDCVLEMARFAVIAVNPELTDDDPGAVPRDNEVIAAEHVLIAANTLQRVIDSYRAVIKADAGRTQPSLPGGDDDPF